ncbi:MAG: FIVAR domain-containing protein, partial [Clostridia bacterium]|nr:FIVAR domain-containing protein [Clostridia bacterium]
ETELVEKPTVDKSALQSAVENAFTAQGNYTDDSWNAYQEALENANSVLNDDEATQDEVNQACNDLASAKAALVDTTALKNSITRAENISEASIESGWEELQSALNTAKTVINKSNATQTEVDNAANALNTAISNLKYAEVAGTHVYSIQKLSSTATAGKYAGLIIYTDPAVTALTFKDADGNDVEPAMCIQNTQTLADGERGVWLVNIYIGAAGDYTYTVYANGTESGTVTITAK